MLLVVVVLLLAVGAGRLLGGRVRRLADVTVRGGWMLVAALAAQVVASASGTAAAVALVVSQAAPLAFMWVNRALPGMPLVIVGQVLNAAVILANGAMPVAIGREGAPAGRHRLLAPGDRLAFLADVVGVPPLGIVVSAGDLVLAAGVGVLVVRLMLRLPAQPVEGRGQPVAQ